MYAKGNNITYFCSFCVDFILEETNKLIGNKYHKSIYIIQAYMLVKRTITDANTTVPPSATNNDNKKIIFKSCAPITDCISEINNTQIDSAKNNDVVMPMHNLIEYSNNYQKTSEIYDNISEMNWL